MPKPMTKTRARSAGRIPRVILLVESSRSSGRSLLRGIANYARHHGPWAFIWEPGGLEKGWPQLRSVDADGIVLRDVDRVDEIVKSGLPAVVIGHSQREVAGLVNVISDSEAIGTLAADHLLQGGLRQFAYCGFEGMPWSILRGDAFRQRIESRGFQVHTYPGPEKSRASNWTAERESMVRWLRSLPKPIGLMACNDDRGEQVIEACKSAGILVPDEIAVIGADNDDLVCDLSDPPMSSVGIGFERAGYEAAEALDRLMRRRSVPNRRILVHATQVVTRRSTDIVAAEDSGVATALRYIRDHSNENISVPDVARAAGLSRRVLEKRFRHLLRRSALEEIRRVRAEKIGRLLVETTQPVAEIALNLGFGSPDHVARYFSKATGLTPLKYRRQFGAR